MVTQRKTPAPKPSETAHQPLTEVGRTDAARFMGCSVATVKRWEKEGILSPRKDGQGQHWFALSDLEAVKAERQGVAPPETETMVATIDNSQAMASSSLKHTERILNIVLDPGESLLNLYKETCKDLREELTKTRAELFELLGKMTELLKAQRQEDLEQYRIELSNKRKEQAIGLVKQAIPLLIAQATGNKQLGQLLGFVQSLHPEQLRILSSSGLLTPEQAQLLSQLLTEDQRAGLAGPENTSDERSPEENSQA